MSQNASKIRSLLEELTVLEHTQSRYNDVVASLNSMNAEWQSMDKQLDKELRDIKELEKLGIKSLFHKVLGSKEEQLEKERQEYLALSLKYKELNKSIEISEYEITVLEKKLVSKDRIVKELNQLKKTREAEILRTNAPQKNELLVIIQKEEKAIRMQEEIRQATLAGQSSLNSLKTVLTHLANAQKWGQWDMYNDSSYYDHLKHGAIDKAVDEAYRTKHQLAIFRDELADVGFTQSFQLNVEAFSKFTDIFFDNLISDWIVQKKIKNVISSVSATHDKVMNLLQTLDQDYSKLNKNLDILSQNRDNILLN